MTTTTIPAWPKIEAIARADGTGEVRIDGTSRPVTGPNADTVRAAIISQIVEAARQVGRPVRATTNDPGGRWRILVHPDGKVEDDDQPVSAPTPPRMDNVPSAAALLNETPPSKDTPGEAMENNLTHKNAPFPRAEMMWGTHDDAGDIPATAAEEPETSPGSGVTASGQVPTPEQNVRARHAVSFLEEPAGDEEPAAPPAKWWQRVLGITPPGPTEEELAERRDTRTVSQPWLGPRTVAVVNGKGGSNKTPTTALLAAIFARYGGGGVLAWDNNDTRGTLGWRTEQSPHHDATVQDLIPATQELMDARAALSKISNYVHHQSDDKYDVLRSNPELLAAEQRLTTEQFRAVHEVAQRYFRLTVMDSGNDESSYNWLNMLDAADQLVVSTTTAPDRTENALLLLTALWSRGDSHSQNLARNAAVIVSQADREGEEGADVVAAKFRELTGDADAVVTVPHDPALRRMQLRYSNLACGTQRAYLRAAAVISHHLNVQTRRS